VERVTSNPVLTTRDSRKRNQRTNRLKTLAGESRLVIRFHAILKQALSPKEEPVIVPSTFDSVKILSCPFQKWYDLWFKEAFHVCSTCGIESESKTCPHGRSGGQREHSGLAKDIVDVA